MKESKYYYVTKYYLTQGIQKISRRRAKIVNNEGGGGDYLSFGYAFLSRKEWFETEGKARAHARVLVDRRIKSLKKQLAELEQRTPETDAIEDL